MKLDVKFTEQTTSFTPNFGEVHNISDGGYERGYAEGEKVGYNNGYVEGSAYYNAMWDEIQQNGNRTDYHYVFSGYGWNDASFKPKYPMKPTHMYNAFRQSFVKTSPYLKEIDFSACEAVYGCFAQSTVEELGVIDCTNVLSGWNGLTQIFYECTKLRKVEKLIFPKSSMVVDAFGTCNSLEEVTFEGTAYRTMQLHWSTNLSVASMKSLISCLYNHTGTSTEYTYTLKFAEESWAALEADSTAPDGGTWRAYVNSLGWNT